MRATLLPVLAATVLMATACGGSPSEGAATSGPTASSVTSSVPAASEGLAPQGRTISGLPVDRVIDGDTVKVVVDGQDVTVRMIGIDTPETVKPDSPVECFGPEASDFAKQRLTGATVTLEFDDGQGETDQYGRTLAYVWIEEDGGLRLFNLEAVAGGYAEERQYGPTPVAWKDELRAAERAAQQAGAGQWGACQGS